MVNRLKHTPPPGGEHPSDEVLSAVLRRLRRQQGLSQREMARRLHLSSHSSVADFEAGRRIPHTDLLADYEKIFCLPTGNLRQLRDRALAMLAAREQAAKETEENTSARENPWRETPGSVRPNYLPPDLPMFVGRRQEILRVAGAERYRMVGIFGAPGIGKTALAIHLATLTRSRFQDGQLFIDLKGDSTRALTATAALSRLLRSLHVPPLELPSSIEEKIALYRSITADRRLTIVLDNALDELQVRPLLPASDSCLVLITSRRALHGLALNEVQRLGRLSEDDSRLLLLHASGRPGLGTSPGMESILAYCQGHPLALTSIGGRLAARPQWSASRLATLLRESSRVLDHFDNGDLSVRERFARTYRLLPELQQCLFRRAALLRGGPVDAGVAAALLDRSPAEAEQTLEQLVDAHLLEMNGETAYRLGGLLGAYADECETTEEHPLRRRDAVERLDKWYITSASNAGAVIAGHVAHYRDTGDTPWKPLNFVTRGAATAWCETQRQHLVEVVRRISGQGRYAEAVAVCLELMGFFRTTRHWPEWITMYRIGVTCAQMSGDPKAERLLLHSLGDAYLGLGLLDHAQTCLEGGLRVEESMPAQLRTGSCLTSLGWIHLRRADLPAADHTLALALKTARTAEDQHGLALALCAHGSLLRARGEVAASLETLEESYCLLTEECVALGYELGAVLLELAETRMQLGFRESAARTLEQSARECRVAGDRYGESRAYARLGEYHQRSLNFGAAHDALLRAHTLGAEHRRRSIEANRWVARNPFGLAAVEAVGSMGEPAGDGPQGQLAWITGMQSDWDSIPIGA